MIHNPIYTIEYMFSSSFLQIFPEHQNHIPSSTHECIIFGPPTHQRRSKHFELTIIRIIFPLAALVLLAFKLQTSTPRNPYVTLAQRYAFKKPSNPSEPSTKRQIRYKNQRSLASILLPSTRTRRKASKHSGARTTQFPKHSSLSSSKATRKHKAPADQKNQQLQWQEMQIFLRHQEDTK